MNGTSRSGTSAATSDAQVVAALTRAYGRSLYNGLTRGAVGTRRWRLAAVLAGLVGWLTVFAAVRWGVAAMIDFVPYADRVIVKGLDVLFLVLLGAMTYSSMLVALVHLYTADDLRLLGTLPASNGALFFGKWIEIGVVSSWAPVCFGGAILAGAGAGFAVSWTYYPATAFGLVLLATIPVSIAMGLTTVAVNAFPANRTRDVLVFSSLVILLALFVAARSLRPERLVDPAAVRELSALLAGLDPPGAGWLPSSWLAAIIAPHLVPGAPSGWPSALLLVVGAVGACGLGLLAFQPLFRRGISQTITSRGRALTGTGRAVRTIDQMLRLLPRAVGAVARKDLLQFGRDPSQWSQLLLLLALVAIYLLNVRIIPLDQMRALGLERPTAADLFAVGNLLFIGFVLAAVALRFSFSGVSLEGRAAWIVLCSPLGARRLLAAKVVPGVVLLGLFGLLLVGGSDWILGPRRAIAGLTLAAAGLLAGGLGGLGVGIGAMAPRFRAENPARIAGSMGGLMFMVASMAFVTAEVSLLAYPAYLISRGTMPAPLAAAAATVFAALALTLPAVVAGAALLFGQRALEARRAVP